VPVAQPPDERNGAIEDLNPLLLQDLVEELVLSVAEPADGLVLRRVGGIASRESNAAGLKKACDAIVSWLAVDIRPLVTFDIKRPEGLSRLCGALVQVLIKEALPGCGVHAGCSCHNSVEVEDCRVKVLHPHARVIACRALLVGRTNRCFTRQ
jgi:hypothetical protein